MLPRYLISTFLSNLFAVSIMTRVVYLAVGSSRIMNPIAIYMYTYEGEPYSDGVLLPILGSHTSVAGIITLGFKQELTCSIDTQEIPQQLELNLAHQDHKLMASCLQGRWFPQCPHHTLPSNIPCLLILFCLHIYVFCCPSPSQDLGFNALMTQSHISSLDIFHIKTHLNLFGWLGSEPHDRFWSLNN